MSLEHEAFRALYPDFTAFPLDQRTWGSDEYMEWSEHLHECSECGDWYQLMQVEERGVDVSAFPCVHVAYYSTTPCDVHADAWECPDMTLVKTGRGFGIPVRDGGSSSIEIQFCPWCGTKL